MRHFVPALKQFSAAQLWNKRSADYLYGLALVHFNDMEVKAVDSFSRGQKNWFKREVVSYIHENLRERKKKKKKKQRKPLWKGVYIAGTSTKASTSMGIKYINIKFRRHYCVDQTRPCSHTNWVCDTVVFLVKRHQTWTRQSTSLHHRRLKMMLDDNLIDSNLTFLFLFHMWALHFFNRITWWILKCQNNKLNTFLLLFPG